MTTITNDLSYDKKYVEEFSKTKEEPTWMTELRVDAYDQANKLDMPEPDKTNINRWNFTEFKLGSEGEKIDDIKNLPNELTDFVDQDNVPDNLLILRNQSIAYSKVSEELTNKGVIFTDIFTALKEHSELVKKYYMTDAVTVNEHKLTALHAALMNGGVFVYVPKNVQIEEPIQTLYWQEDNAKVSFGAVDHFAEGTTAYINRRGVAGANAQIDWALGQMNEGNTISENSTHLVGDGSVTNPRTVTVGKGRQIQNFTAQTVHHGLNTDGQISQRGVMLDKTTAIFNAIGKIDDGASGANAEQESRILMLSKGARGDANPILLIDEDDVTAGHAASVGRIDELQMYYLQSRGITPDEAKRLIIHGFLAPVVKELPIETIKAQLTELIERKFD